MTIKYYPVIDMISTGRNISELRKARGLSVADLQEYFGFEAPQAIYKWQKGQSLPSTDNLYALAFLFGVTVDEIIIPIKPKIQALPQDKTCGSGRFGKASVLVRMLHILFKGFTKGIVIPPVRAVTISPRQIFDIHPLAVNKATQGLFRFWI